MDRKAWIVIVLCCIGLAVNLYFSGQNREALVEQQRKEQQAEKEAEKEVDGEKPGEIVPPGDLEAPASGPSDPPEPVVKEETPTLSTGGATFTFTTHGGGIKNVEMLEWS